MVCLGCDPRRLAGSKEGAGEEQVAGEGLGDISEYSLEVAGQEEGKAREPGFTAKIVR